MIDGFILDPADYLKQPDVQELLNEENLTGVYNAYYYPSKLTRFFIDNNIDPLPYMEGITSVMYHSLPIESIELPNNIKWIEDCAFQECTSLRYIKIPSSVRRIAYTSFKGCDLDNLTIICEAGSEAHIFARINNISFELEGDKNER